MVINYSDFQSRDRYLDSHSFMESLKKDIEESDFGSVVYSTRVVRVDPYDAQPGWVAQMITENIITSLVCCLRAL